jgi:TetR/AcrR family transcriptional regulator, transcriptional repressor for nem operon
LIIQLNMPSKIPERSDTRDRIVEAARFLFWEKGYAATGLAELLERASANSGSFYHFFESKDALLRTVLDTYVELLDPHIVRPAFAASADPFERIFALLDGYRNNLIRTGCRYGCPIGRLALEIDPENTPAHALIARNFSAWRQAVESCLRAAGIPKPEELAALTLTVMEGGVMQSRAYRSIEPFDACVRQLRKHLNAAKRARKSLPSPPRRGNAAVHKRKTNQDSARTPGRRIR